MYDELEEVMVCAPAVLEICQREMGKIDRWSCRVVEGGNVERGRSFR